MSHTPSRARVLALTLALLALGLPLAACGQGADTAGPESAPTGGTGGAPNGSPGAPGASIPATLVGQWYAGTVSPTDYYDAGTGHWSGNGYGSGVMYTFAADGHYTFAYQTSTRLYGCYTLTLFHVKGDMRVDAAAGTYDLRPTSGTKLERSNCGGGNGDAPLQGKPESGFYQLRQGDDGTPVLYTKPLDGSSGWAPLRRVTP